MPRLILVSGPPGVGKSTLARGLARALRAAHLDKDPIDEPFSPGDRGKRYTEEIEPRVLQALLGLASLNLSNGLDVLLDVPWTHILLNSPEWVARIEEAARGHELRVLELVVSEATLRGRLSARGETRDRVKLDSAEGWARFRASDRLGERNPLPHLVIDAELPPAEILARALAALR